MPRKSTKTPSFEEGLNRLTEIVEEVEDSETTLENAINLYKEGISLAEKCGEVLRNYEAEILILQKSANDLFKLEPFQAG